ncbi:hypothetical protein DASC09_002690 [Saccharomycopsis crataegensis]|uniref:3-hydroxyisobutyryl-CoA hydrolase n=1 Tax=Saccharomycopsis crataegensis TaxID=43959 RepID=A0AAV5QE35_9ASCO|nr:hypothetical protein DASC09_002690 [Saccharomycopsis crataegensis]
MGNKYPIGPTDSDITIDDSDVLFDVDKYCGVITLNRAKKLNSLNISMIDKLFQFYITESKSKVNLFIQTSATSRAFCAGGDVVALAKFDNAGYPENSIRLFVSEYSMNYFLSRFKKPVVSLLNGITMGGGCGLSLHSPFRVVTESTRLAMPEMAIGFFPDVGASYFFSRLEGYLGWYLCLTGDILQGYDNMFAGTGTHFVRNDKLGALTKALVAISNEYGDKFEVGKVTGYYHEWYGIVNETIESFAETAPPGYQYQYSTEELKIINEMFSSTTTIEGVFEFLEDLVAKKNNWFAKQTLKKFEDRSLLSIKIGYKILQYGATHDNYQALSEELTLSNNMNINHDKLDLTEGIFKKLILKTNDPDWKFKNIHNIPDEYVEKWCFSPTIERFGAIHKFSGNWALYPDSHDYVLNKFTLPTEALVDEYLDHHRDYSVKSIVDHLQGIYPQLKAKRGITEKVEFIMINKGLLQNTSSSKL